MRSSLLRRRNWKPVVAALGVAAGFVVGGGAEAAGTRLLGLALTLVDGCGRHRAPRRGAPGDFGYLEAGPGAFPGPQSG